MASTWLPSPPGGCANGSVLAVRRANSPDDAVMGRSMALRTPGALRMPEVQAELKGRETVLKRVFVGICPGGLRLRGALRAVLGIGLAVALCGATCFLPRGAVVEDLPLAFFTVTDATVRGPALRAAALRWAFLFRALHPARPPIGARRRPSSPSARCWCVRPARARAGDALGVFGLHGLLSWRSSADRAGATALAARAVLLALLASSAVRFGLWCFERRMPPAGAPAPSAGRGLARPTTRQAVQAVVAAAFALGVGSLPVQVAPVLGRRRRVVEISPTSTSRGETRRRLPRGPRNGDRHRPRGLGRRPLHGAPVPTVACSPSVRSSSSTVPWSRTPG